MVIANSALRLVGYRSSHIQRAFMARTHGIIVKYYPTVTSEDVCWGIRNVKSYFNVFYNMRCFIMTSVTGVCVLFLLKLKWPENKSFYDKVGASFWWMLLFIRVEFTFLVLSFFFFRMFVDVDPDNQSECRKVVVHSTVSHPTLCCSGGSRGEARGGPPPPPPYFQNFSVFMLFSLDTIKTDLLQSYYRLSGKLSQISLFLRHCIYAEQNVSSTVKESKTFHTWIKQKQCCRRQKKSFIPRLNTIDDF